VPCGTNFTLWLRTFKDIRETTVASTAYDINLDKNPANYQPLTPL
jgi:hypothetical protein